MKKSNFQFLIIFIILVSFTSCSTKKKLVYFQGKEISSSTEINTITYTPILATNDFLNIAVRGIDPDAVLPFNLPQLTTSSSSMMNGGYTTGTPSLQGYLIGTDGTIDFPVLGQIKLAGLDRMTATNLIKEKLKPYIDNPQVHIRILNYKVTVLGEVNMPGTFSIPNERITLLEVLGLAGDLTIRGVRNNVLVVREVEGKKTETRVDLTSKEIFNSPVYYLRQNDVVYVEPNRARINSSVVNPTNISIVVSLISVIIATITLVTRIK